jgi:ATP-dependent Lon protease
MMIDEKIDILPLRGVVIYPQAVTPLAVAQPAAIRLIDSAAGAPCRVGLCALRGEEGTPERIGTLALVHRLLRLPDGTLRVAVEGLERFEIVEWLDDGATPRARIRLLPDLPVADLPQRTLLVERLKQLIDTRLLRLPGMQQERIAEIEAEADPQRLSFLLAGPLLMPAPLTERQNLLEERDGLRRLALLIDRLEALPQQPRPAPDEQQPDHHNPDLEPGEALWLSGAGLLRIETLLVPGPGRLVCTGLRGRIVYDGVQTALAWVRSHLTDLGCVPAVLDTHDLYLHLPAVASPDEHAGMSAPLALALAGLLSGRSLRADTVILAGLSLRGRLLPIKRLGERIEIAAAAGLRRIVIAATDAAPELPPALSGNITILHADRLLPLLDELLLPRTN